MRKTILSILAAVVLFPALSFAGDNHRRYGYDRYDRVYDERPWHARNRRGGYWHLHRAERKHKGKPIYYRHWHPYERYESSYDRPWYRFGR
jgi:hypothetical protein